MPTPASSPPDARVTAALEFMAGNLGDPLDDDRLAARVNLSPSRLRALFRRHAGRSPQAALKEARLQKAALLLRTTFLTIKEVAAEVGYSDASHFIRDFKRRFGHSPAGHRASHPVGAAPVAGAGAVERTVVLANK